MNDTCDLVDDGVVRVSSNVDHKFKVLWFTFSKKGSIGMPYAEYLHLKNDKLGSSLFDSKLLEVM